MATRKKPKTPKSVKTLTHAEERRKKIPTAEYQSIVEKGNANHIPREPEQINTSGVTRRNGLHSYPTSLIHLVEQLTSNGPIDMEPTIRLSARVSAGVSTL
jgi:hypothetical protein